MRRFYLIILTLLLFGCGKKPTADFSWSPKSPKVGETVTFTNNSKDAKKYDWNLGNMKISSDKNPQTTYDIAGDYTIDLTARSGLKKDTKTLKITVTQ